MLTHTEYTNDWRAYHAEGYAELFAPRPGSIYAAHARVVVRWAAAVSEEEKRRKIADAQREAQRP